LRSHRLLFAQRGVAFVSLLSVLLLFLCAFAGCKSSVASRQLSSKSATASEKKNSNKRSLEGAGNAAQARVIARLEDASIDESSGLVASRRNPDLFWTHNDSGDDPFIFAFDRQGKRRGVWRVEGAKARDWEDIAIGPGPERGRPYLYVGDIGNNGKKREEIIVYRFPEPAIETGDAGLGRRNARRTEMADVIRMRYPDGAHDAETLMVHPATGDIYIVTKNISLSVAVVYKLSPTLSLTNVNVLARVGEIQVPSLLGSAITGGDISPDGRRAVLCDYLGAYEFSLAADSDSSFDAIWKQPAVTTQLGPRGQGEAVCYRLDGAAILATSEGRNAPLIEVEIPLPARATPKK
jgi:hypothetical protein